MFQFNGGHTDPEADAGNDHKLLSDSIKAEKRQSTRNRTSYSCLTCRRRKVKCDKLRPICGGCQRAGEQCLYSDDMPLGTAQPVSSKGESSPVWKKRKSSLAGQDSTHVLSADVARNEDDTPPTDLRAIEEQLRRLTTMVDSLRSGNGNGLRLKELLTPEPASSESGSDVA